MSERLYELLPTFLRLRDSQSGEALRALMGIIETQVDRVEADVEQLYDNWFIETCAEWVVPYIGDLLATRGHVAVDAEALSLRPYVANTLGFRRRKGTAAMLEDLALSVTGWPARAVEMFERLCTTQYANHVRMHALRTPDLRDTANLELIDGPFDTSLRLADVRRISRQQALGGVRGAPANLPNIAVFLWRIAALEAIGVRAVADAAAGAGRFRFDPLGADVVMHNPARTESSMAGRTDEVDVPGAIRPRAIYDEAVAARTALSDGRTPRFGYLDAGAPAFRIVPEGESEIPPERVQICNLGGWATAPPPASVTLPDGTTFTPRVAVDPALGRLVFVSGPMPAAVRVSYYYGTPAEIGGGSYARPEPDLLDPRPVYSVSVADWTLDADLSLSANLGTWVADGRPDAIIEITDSGTYSVANLDLPVQGSLEIRARDGARPLLMLTAPWECALAARAALILRGLAISGDAVELATTVAGDDVEHALTIDHCTMVPGTGLTPSGDPASPAAVVLATAPTSEGSLTIDVRHAIVGRIDVTAGAAGFAGHVDIADSIIDGSGDASPALRADRARIDRATVLGATEVRELHASDAVFTARVEVTRTQIGCARYSYAPRGSQLPRAYRCQPGLALARAQQLGAGPTEEASILARMVPAFTSVRYRDPGYAQLAATCPLEIRIGASNASEMGAYQHLAQPQREANLRASLDEYLRFGLEAGAFFVT